MDELRVSNSGRMVLEELQLLLCNILKARCCMSIADLRGQPRQSLAAMVNSTSSTENCTDHQCQEQIGGLRLRISELERELGEARALVDWHVACESTQRTPSSIRYVPVRDLERTSGKDLLLYWQTVCGKYPAGIGLRLGKGIVASGHKVSWYSTRCL